jgi:hypothetical protein
MGKMHIVYGECGHVIAACWVTGNEVDAANFKRRKLRAGHRLETVDRYAGDPMPEWCYSACPRTPGVNQC